MADDSTDNSNSNGPARRQAAKTKAAIRAAGQQLSSSGESMMSDARDVAASKIGAVSYRKGGKVRKTKRSSKAMRKMSGR